MVDDPNSPDNHGSFMEEDEFLAAERPEEATQSAKANFKEIWDQNPSLKIFAVVSGIAILLIGFMVFGGESKKPDDASVVRQTAEVSQPPGTAQLPPAYEDAVREASDQRAKEAAETGGSSIPTPIARPSERIEAPVQVEQTDPLSEWRKEAEARSAERKDNADVSPPAATTNAAPPSLSDVPTQNPNGTNNLNANNQQPQNPPLPTGPTPDQVNGMAQQLQQQMQTILETQVPRESVVVSMNVQPGYDMAKYFPPENAANNQNSNAANTSSGTAGQAANTSGQNAQQTPPKPIIQAGTIAYGQILTEANSDVPGPVLAEVASGPLTGGRAIGSFQVAQRNLVLQFNRIVKDGVEYPTQAYALDPGTTLPGVATDVDNHYFQRVFLPAAARFIQGFAEAATQTDSTVVVTNGTVVSNSNNDLDTKQELLKGVNEGAQKASQIFDENADRPVTIKVAAGTRIGLLFVNSVMDPNGQVMQQNGFPQQGGYSTQAQVLGQNFYNVAPANTGYNGYNNYNNNTGYNAYNNANSGSRQTYTGSGGQQYNYIPLR